MHPSALHWGKRFFDTYTGNVADGIVIDVGSLDVNGSLKQACPPGLKYVGVDFTPGKGVDMVLDDPYRLPFDDRAVDVVVSSSCFEHSEMFWLLFIEILRVLKESGLFYLNVPSNGPFHQYPVDCWRFYPDSGKALVTWARRCKVDALLLESCVGRQQGTGKHGIWNDFVAVFLKNRAFAYQYPQRMLDTAADFTNGLRDATAGYLNPAKLPEDQARLRAL